eukprot:12289-Heterococcus_DN1.PRE.2
MTNGVATVRTNKYTGCWSTTVLVFHNEYRVDCYNTNSIFSGKLEQIARHNYKRTLPMQSCSGYDNVTVQTSLSACSLTAAAAVVAVDGVYEH